MTKSGKHCIKRRNCSFWAISSLVTMFSKSCLMQRRQKASIWGKGLKESFFKLLHENRKQFSLFLLCFSLTICSISKKLENDFETKFKSFEGKEGKCSLQIIISQKYFQTWSSVEAAKVDSIRERVKKNLIKFWGE